ncbi:MAG: MGDG synthase family glycosyltransferase [Chthoniobacterales bacterium]
MKRILILTASFGEGHNTAAKNIREALLKENPDSVEVTIADIYQKTNPACNKGIQVGYSLAINRFTTLWRFLFCLLSCPGLLEFTIPLFRGLRKELQQQIHDFQPHVIVSTYPVYSFLITHLREVKPSFKTPFITVVTDSTMINSAWYRSPSTAFIVPDKPTAKVLTDGNISPATIHILGFPVSQKFTSLPREIKNGPPWKILHLPSSRQNWTIHALRLLNSLPNLEITVVTGKFKAIRKALEDAGLDRAPRIKILGWTDDMPQLLATHHLFIGKAGGAIVQEALAAHCPFIVSHVVPGQEEGNIALIEKSKIGLNASNTPDELHTSVQKAFADDGAQWKIWKQNIAHVTIPDAALQNARFILSLAKENKPSENSTPLAPLPTK